MPVIVELSEYTNQFESLVVPQENTNDRAILSQLIPTIWTFGFLLVVSYRFAQLKHIAKIVRQARPFDPNKLSLYFDLESREYMLRKNIRILRSEAAISPFTIGILYPVIVLPEKILESRNVSVIEPVILHEIEHIKNRDMLWLSVYNLLTALFFFNPIVWMARKKHYRYTEEFCDAKIMLSGKVNIGQYGRSLIFVNQFLNHNFPKSIPAMRLKSSSLWHRLNSLKGGKMMKRENKLKVVLTLLFLFMASLIVSFENAREPGYAFATKSSVVQKEDLEYMSPIKKGYISSDFGERIHPIKKVKMMHYGIDIAAKTGTPVFAVDEGEVIFAKEKGNYGQLIVIRHKNKVESRYAQLGISLVKEGQLVKQGQIIAEIGHSKYGTGPHLHFEFHIKGEPVSPTKYIDLDLSSPQ